MTLRIFIVFSITLFLGLEAQSQTENKPKIIEELFQKQIAVEFNKIGARQKNAHQFDEALRERQNIEACPPGYHSFQSERSFSAEGDEKVDSIYEFLVCLLHVASGVDTLGSFMEWLKLSGFRPYVVAQDSLGQVSVLFIRINISEGGIPFHPSISQMLIPLNFSRELSVQFFIEGEAMNRISFSWVSK